MKGTLVLFISCLLAIQVAADVKLTEIPRKRLAGPPSEFKNHVIPTPLHGALTEDSTYIPITLQAKHTDKETTKVSWEYPLLVDSKEAFSISFFSPMESQLKLKLKDPKGKEVDMKPHAVQGNFPIGLQEIPETTYLFEDPEVGTWMFKVESKEKYSGEKLLKMTSEPQATIILWNKSKTKAHTHLNSYDLTLGQKIGLITEVTDAAQIIAGVRPNPMKEVISEAELEIVLPDGSEIDVEMHDDGLHDDLEANDGVFGATIPSTEIGTYVATAWIAGVNADGTKFERTTQHLIPVVTDSFDFTGEASGTYTDTEHMNIYIGLVSPKQTDDTLFRAYAEVWGKDASGNDVAACWIGGMTEVKQIGNQYALELELNLKWLAMAGVTTPLTLKQIVAQETTSYIPIDVADSMPVTVSSLTSQYIANTVSKWEVTEITTEMRNGRRMRPLLKKESNSTAVDGKLLLIHGYCSGTNPWSPYASDFSNAAFFLEPNANMNNQAFAAKVYNWAEANGYGSYGLAGHSQGGMIGLHLLNYYDTGLDDAQGTRVLQSLGTPFQGCSAAGSAANLGKLFGAGCGSNTDLATDGARLWLAGITATAQSSVHYYTTTYEQGKFFGDWCNLAMNALLEWPNDGTTEIQFAGLTHGKYLGNTEKQCHTTGMGYMAQYSDRSRNVQINQHAAR